MSTTRYFEDVKINLVSLGARIRIQEMNKLVEELKAPVNDSKNNKILQFLNLSKNIKKKKEMQSNLTNYQKFVRDIRIFGQSLYSKNLKDYSESLKKSMDKTVKSAGRIKNFRINALIKSKSIDQIRNLIIKKNKTEKDLLKENSTALPSVLSNKRESKFKFKPIVNLNKRYKSPSSVMITTGKGFFNKTLKLDENHYNINDLIRYNPYQKLRNLLF